MHRAVAPVLWVILLSSFACTDNAATPDPQPPYFSQVKDIIANHCLSCHSASGSWVGRPVALDTDDEIVADAEAIKRAVADPASPTNRRMPQGETLSPTEIAIIVDWFNSGGQATN